MMSFAEFSLGKVTKIIELHNIVASPRAGAPWRNKLNDFKSQAMIGDQFIYYCSDASEWNQGMGSEGYAIVRNEQIVATIILMMN